MRFTGRRCIGSKFKAVMMDLCRIWLGRSLLHYLDRKTSPRLATSMQEIVAIGNYNV